MSRITELLELLNGVEDSLIPMKEEKARLNAYMAPYEQQAASIRNEIHDLMTEEGVNSINGGGYKATRAKRNTFHIDSVSETKDFLERTGMLQNYIQLDQKKIEGLTKTIPVPGTRWETSYDLRITPLEKVKP